MAILEEEVLVTLHGTNVKHFEKLGYKIPRDRVLNGKMVFPSGTKLLVKVNDLQPSSMTKLTKVCDNCGKQKTNQSYDSITKLRKKGDGKDRCFECGKKKAREKLLNTIKYENSLEYWAKENNKIYLINEYSNKNKKKTSEISYGSGQKYIWNCPKCTSEYVMTADNRTNMNCNCPYCRGSQVNHTNSIWSLRPDIASLLKYKEKGNQLTIGSNKVQEFICPNCGDEQKKMINAVVRQGFLSCNKCGDGISYGEKFMASVLDQLNIGYQKEKCFEWLKNRRYDFYIYNENHIIETHGIQHYESVFYRGRSLEEERLNDELKLKTACNNGISKYIVINCSKSDMFYIKNSIIKSEMNELYNLENIDWTKCHEFAIKSNMLKTVCDLWNLGIKSTVEIGKIVKLERGTVSRYLKKGKKLLWCDYDTKEVQRQNGIKSGHGGKRKVIQLTLNSEFIKEWECAKDATNELGITNIAYACNGKYGHAGGFKWSYKDDYDKELNAF